MNRRALRAGDHIWVEVPSPDGMRRVDTQLVARDDDQLLVVCHPEDLDGLDVTTDSVVTASWHRDHERTEIQAQVSHVATYPVGSLVLTDHSDSSEDERGSGRLHRVLPAQLWTPETGHLAATVVDISCGGARLRLRERPPPLECEAVLGCGDELVEVRAKVLEIIPAGVAGRQHEVRLQFTEPGDAALERLDAAVRHGVTEAMVDLGFDARRAV